MGAAALLHGGVPTCAEGNPQSSCLRGRGQRCRTCRSLAVTDGNRRKLTCGGRVIERRAKKGGIGASWGRHLRESIAATVPAGPEWFRNELVTL